MKNEFAGKVKRSAALLIMLTTIAGVLIVFWAVQRADREMRQGLLNHTRLVAGAVCHEMNQPLQVVSGLSEMLLMVVDEGDKNHEDHPVSSQTIFERLYR